MIAARRAVADHARGFLPDDEAMALHRAATSVAGPILEVGAYCGKSAVWLGDAAEGRTVVFSVDHHRGSEENQAGWEHHDPTLVDPVVGLMDTLPFFRQTIFDAGLEATVVAVVGPSATVARWWATPLGFLFIDGGHGVEPARADYLGWTPHVAVGGLLAIHDVYPDPSEGGRPPYEEIYRPALASGQFEEDVALSCRSLRVLRRVQTAPAVLRCAT